MSFAGITDFWAYVIGCIAIVLLPGPNSLFVMSTAALADRRRGWAAVAGVLVADTVFIVGSALGLVALLEAMPWLFDALRWIGAAYLVWLGALLMAGAWRAWRTPAARATAAMAGDAAASGGAGPAGGIAAAGGLAADVGESRAGVAGGDPAGSFRKAVAIGLLNPKAMMFYVAFFPQFVDSASSNWLTFVVMGAILQLCSFVYLVALVASGASLAAAARRSRWLGAFGKTATGALFIGFGAKLAGANPVQ
ncbi:MAG: leucine efflux protein LeuE [Burkholderiaceae bacterium]|nr:leucine efflux protein LeuE [Burkholderiaceae bacterium]